MSIEILDRGSCKAAGVLTFTPAPGNNVFVGLGISALETIDANTVRLTLVEPIASTEFLALAGPRSNEAYESCSITWETDTTFRVENIDDSATVSLDLQVYRLAGRGTQTSAAIPPPPPPNLDGLDAEGLAQRRYGHWSGGALLSSYAGPWGQAERDDDALPPIEFSSIAEVLAFAAGTTARLSETRDQWGGNHMSVDPLRPDRKAVMGVLCEAGAPVLDSGGTLAYRLDPYVDAGPVDIASYAVAGSLGLPLDDSAWTIVDNAHSDDLVCGMIGFNFAAGLDGSADWPTYGGPSNGDLFMGGYIGGYYADTFWEDAVIANATSVVLVKPAGATPALVQPYADNVLCTDQTTPTSGVFTLAGVTHTWYASPPRIGATFYQASVFLVFEGVLSPANRAVVAAFLAAVRP